MASEPNEAGGKRKPDDIKRAQTVPSAVDSAAAKAKAAQKQIDAVEKRRKDEAAKSRTKESR